MANAVGSDYVSVVERDAVPRRSARSGRAQGRTGGEVLGQRVSNFEVVRLLGEGGMGAVYEAKHPLIGKRVAIKVLKPERSVDPEAVQRFLTEARVTSAI